MNFKHWYKKFIVIYKLSIGLIKNFNFSKIESNHILEQIKIIGPDSLSITIVTACFIGMVFTLQVVKEFLYFDMVNLLGSIFTIAFIRELSPVLTSIIIIGRIGSYFTAELATMKVTDQIDALYLLNVSPFFYLVAPRVLSSIVMLPLLNIFAFATSLASSAFICFTLFDIDPFIFFTSSFSSLSFADIIKSSCKTIIFGFFISIISCSFGLKTTGGAKGVGISTTSSVVICLFVIFILDFILSYLMFSQLESLIKTL